MTTRKYAENNRPVIYRKMRINELQIKRYTGGYPYYNNGLLLRSSVSEPIYSYAKNYKKYGKEFSLFVWTTEKDEEVILGMFDRSLKNVKRKHIDDIDNHIVSFAYLEDK